MKKSLYLLLFVSLFSCTNNNHSASDNKEISNEKQISGTKANIDGILKTGVYHAYQLSGAGYGFQYKFELMNENQYKMFDKTGSYEFDPSTNVIRFTSGGLKDFTGIFTRTDYNNNTRKLMIVLDFHGDGSVPDTLALGKKPGLPGKIKIGKLNRCSALFSEFS